MFTQRLRYLLLAAGLALLAAVATTTADADQSRLAGGEPRPACDWSIR